MSALAKVEDAPIADYAAGLLAVIERAARDPSVDIDKMERLLAMQERVQERNAKAEFTAAKIAMRPELPEITMKGAIRIVKDGKVTQETPFARFEDIHDAVMPVLTAHGFDLSYRNGLSPDGKVRVTTILSHVSGHEEETIFDLPHDSSGSKNSVQAVGSSTSYGKRYGTLSILNIKVCGEDDDGGAASELRPASMNAPALRQIETPIHPATVPVYDWLRADGSSYGCGTELEFNHWKADGVVADDDRLGEILDHEPASEDARRTKAWAA